MSSKGVSKMTENNPVATYYSKIVLKYIYTDISQKRSNYYHPTFIEYTLLHLKSTRAIPYIFFGCTQNMNSRVGTGSYGNRIRIY